MARMTAAIAVALSLAASGCAIGLQIPYDTPRPRLRARGSGTVAIAVLDRRPYVRSGEKKASFCGLMRSGIGIPYDVTTRSGRPLATDIALVVARAVHLGGFQVTLVPSATSSDAAAVQALGTQHADRGLLITIDEWKSDTLVHVSLRYAATAQVRDRQGHVIGQSQIVGQDVVGSSLMAPDIEMIERVPPAVQEQLERLLDDGAIVKALAGATSGDSDDDEEEDKAPAPRITTPRS